MKILQVLNHFLPGQTAGTEVYTWALTKYLLAEDEVEVKVVIPNYGKREDAVYTYDSIEVIQYAEPSVVDRSLIMGKREPEGLEYFKAVLQKEQPAIVHFHELAGSNGITLHHVRAAKASGARVVMTFHLAGYSCATGNLVYKDKELCDGVIRIHKCAGCYLHSKDYPLIAPLLLGVSTLMYRLNIDSTRWNNKAGTALGFPFLISQLKANLATLLDQCDKVVTLTEWYKEVLLRNGVAVSKISLIKQALPVAAGTHGLPLGKSEGDPIRLVFLGRISRYKGLHLLLKAMNGLPEEKIILDIYGQTGEEDYEKECRDLSSGKPNISWKGKLTPVEVVSTLRQYDALCLCSTFSEMSPLVIQEAFAAGIPVIASNVYGNSEQIEHNRNGLLFRFKDAAALEKLLKRCLEDALLLPKLKSNVEVPRLFKEAGEAYSELYKSLLN